MATVVSTRGLGFLSVFFCLLGPLLLTAPVAGATENGWALGATGVAAFQVGAVVNYLVGRQLNSRVVDGVRIWRDHHLFQGRPMQQASWFYAALAIVLGITAAVNTLVNGAAATVVFILLAAAGIVVPRKVAAARRRT